MALSTLTVNKASGTPGKQLLLSAAPLAAAGNTIAATSNVEFPNDGRTLILVENQHATNPTTVGYSYPNTTFGGHTYAASTPGDTLATQKTAIYGPFPTSLNDSNGKIQMTFTSVTSVFCAAISLG